jgi:hypothetical protein
MKKEAEYKQHAFECRRLAEKMERGEQREQLLKMADAWERLAQDRAKRSPLIDELLAKGKR